ncbi:RNA polymerase sigma factor SigJ [Kitasatospora sp. NBC_01300]|uniref:RNA polymerase sigma factor SigJ n=1 Tax=Kitasatospora sp. NBC_01300 TaxID=2903574 RepID=UPI002F918991|nr:RNA polymerase sigma factor SigJ [Kitasatospora sp. NBC_01300]
MGTPSESAHDRSEPDLSTIVGERRRLINLAYRLLGSLSEAEDAVQETYTRWYTMSRQQQAAVASPGAWLTTVASRVCLDVLGSARARRERYVGAWIPEPLPDRSEWIGGQVGAGRSDPADPADRITLDESVNMAFLVVLESMTPAERVAFVLHDVFRYPFAEVAEIVGRTPAACRQLASSGRRRIRAARTAAAPAAPPALVAAQAAQATQAAQAAQATLVRHFKAAWESKDIEALIALLDPAATMTADGGGLVGAVLRPVEGGRSIAQYLIHIAGKAPGLTLLERTVNGRPGLVAQHSGVTVTVAAFETSGGRVSRIWAVRNPEKLRAWTGNEQT